MRRIPILRSPAPVTLPNGQSAPISSLDLFQAVATAAPNGMTVEEMRQRIHLLSRISEARSAGAKHLLVTEEQHTALLASMESARWGVVDEFIVRVFDALAQAPASEDE